MYPLRQISISAIPDDLLSLTYRQLLDELNRLQTDISVYMSEQEMFTCTAELQYIRQCLSLLDSTLIGGRIDGHLQESLNTTQELLISRLAVLYGATQCTDARFFTCQCSVTPSYVVKHSCHFQCMAVLRIYSVF